MRSRRWYGDLEGDGLIDDLTKLWCGSFKNVDTGEWKIFTPENIHTLPSFLDTVDVLIMHNGVQYDYFAIKKVLGYEFKGKMFDTLLLSRLSQPKRVSKEVPRAPHSIEAWGYRVGVLKPDHTDWSQFSDAMLERNKADVEILEKVYRELEKETKGRGLGKAFELTTDLFKYIEMQRQYGWKFDVEYAKKCIRQLERWISLIDRAVEPYLPMLTIKGDHRKTRQTTIERPFKKDGTHQKAVTEYFRECYNDPVVCDNALSNVVGPFSKVYFRKVDLDKNDEIKTWLLDSGWEPLEWNTNNRGERTSPKISPSDEFIGIQGKVPKLISKRLSLKSRRSIIEGLLKAVRPDGRIGGDIGNLAVTGRATHRGIVNIPRVSSIFGKQMRQLFICSPGKVLVGCDSDGNQNRQLAARMGDPEYTEAAINGDKSKGTDLHSFHAGIMGVDRDTGKTGWYAFLFGAQAFKMSKTLRCSLNEAKKILNNIGVRVPGLTKLKDRLQKEWRETAEMVYSNGKTSYVNGKIRGLDGREITVTAEHQVLVYLLQSDEAIHMSHAYVMANKELEKKYVYGIDYGFVLWYHDEIDVECREDIVDDVAKTLEYCIKEAGVKLGIPVPHKGEAKIGRSWYEVH